MDRDSKKGFTLMELLVVTGLVAVLAGSLVFGLGKFAQRAQTAKAQESVSNAATALSMILQKNGSWPSILIQNANGGDGILDDNVAKVFVAFKLLGMEYDKKKYNVTTRTGTIVLMGRDRCGIVDPWAQDVLKKSSTQVGSGDASKRVPSGKTVREHIIRYAIDLDGDGVTEASVNGSRLKIRASAVAWGAGADGVFDPYSAAGRSDDVYSWSKHQVEK